MELTKREAQAKIAEILAEISSLYDEAAEIAEENEIDFSYDGPAGYGDGGYYTAGAGDDAWQASSYTC